jgi:hypothetical protein
MISTRLAALAALGALMFVMVSCTGAPELASSVPHGVERLPDGISVLGEVGVAPAPGATPTAQAAGREAVGSLALVADPSPYGYLPLALFGTPPQPLPSDADDGGFLLGLDLPVIYCNRAFDTLLWSVNGAIEIGSASGGSAPAVHVPLPDAGAPNRLVAPWWTDLDLGGGVWYQSYVSAGGAQYAVLEWVDAATPDGAMVAFQVWFQLGADAIWFVYGPTEGEPHLAAVGAEDLSGTMGHTRYYDGVGTSPWGGPDLRVDSSACTESSNAPPVADAGGPYWGVAGAAVALDGSASYDPDGDALTFAWNAGHAAVVAPDPVTDLDTSAADAGLELRVTLVVTDPSGASDRDTVTVEVLAPVDAIERLMRQVEALVPETLARGRAHGLTRPLHNALRSLGRDKLRPTCSQVGDFEAGLAGLDPVDAEPLRERSRQIRLALGCS